MKLIKTKLLLIFLLLLFIGAGCQKYDTACPCGTEKSFSIPEWINNLQTQLEMTLKSVLLI